MAHLFKDTSSWTLDLAKIPAYKEWDDDWSYPVDPQICELLLKCEDTDAMGRPLIGEEAKANFKNNIVDKIVNGRLHIRWSARHGGLGRRYSSRDPACEAKFSSAGNLGVMAKAIKNTIFQFQDWVDFDMVKGHPTLLLCVAKAKNLSGGLPAVERYIGNFEAIAKEMAAYYTPNGVGEDAVTTDDVKWLHNLTIYGGGHKGWVEKLLLGDPRKNKRGKLVANGGKPHPMYLEFKREMDRINQLVYDSNAELVSKVVDDPTMPLHEQKNRTMSYFCQILENECLSHAYAYGVKAGLFKARRVDLAYDGFTAPRPPANVDLDRHVGLMNAHILKKTGMAITMKAKAFGSVIESVLTERQKMKDEGLEDGVSSDDDAARKLFALYPHWVCCQGVLYVFNDQTGMWDSDFTSHLLVMQRFQKALRLKTKGKEGETILLQTSYGTSLNLSKKLPEFLKTLCRNDNWLRESQYSSLGKILFTNGWYDFKAGLFHPKSEGFNPAIVFMGKIPHAFEPFNEEDTEYIDSIRERLFRAPLGQEMGDYLLTNLARGLAGDLMKRLLFGVGTGESGKGVIMTALSLALGDYAGTFNAENLCIKQGGGDEAQLLRWALLLRFKRLVFSSEMKQGSVMNGNLIKKIASGGDELVGRVHCGNEFAFVPHFLVVGLANDMNQIAPYDDAIDLRLRMLSFKKKFVANPKEPDFELQADDNIKDELKTLRFQKCLVGLLIQSYMAHMELTPEERLKEPEAVRSAKTEWVGEEQSPIASFLREYEVTGKDSDFTASADIERWLRDGSMGLSMRKFTVELTKYCSINKVEGVSSTVKKLAGKCVRGWSGVRLQGDGEVAQRGV